MGNKSKKLVGASLTGVMAVTAATGAVQSIENIKVVEAAASKDVHAAHAKIEHITYSLKKNYLGLKNIGQWQSYIKEARNLIAKLPNGSTKQKFAERINRAEALVNAAARVNQVEKSMLVNANVMKNVDQWEQYINLAKEDLAKVDLGVFKARYNELLERTAQRVSKIENVKTAYKESIKKVEDLVKEAKEIEKTNKDKALEKYKEAKAAAEKLQSHISKDDILKNIIDSIKGHGTSPSDKPSTGGGSGSSSKPAEAKEIVIDSINKISDLKGKSYDKVTIEDTSSFTSDIENLTVKTLIVKGGQSLSLKGCQIDNLTVEDNNNDITIYAEGSTEVKNTNLKSGATLSKAIGVAAPSTGSGVKVSKSSIKIIAKKFQAGSTVAYKNVEINTAEKVKVDAPVSDMKVTAKNANIELAQDVTITNLTVDKEATGLILAGTGTVTNATVNAENTTIIVKYNNIKEVDGISLNDAFEVVKKLIADLKAVDAITLQDKASVEMARAAYESLTKEQKEKVGTDVEKLNNAEAKIVELNKAEAKKVTDKIEALPAADSLNKDSKSAIDEARKLYEALSKDQKRLVSEANVKKLVELEAGIAKLLVNQEAQKITDAITFEVEDKDKKDAAKITEIAVAQAQKLVSEGYTVKAKETGNLTSDTKMAITFIVTGKDGKTSEEISRGLTFTVKAAAPVQEQSAALLADKIKITNSTGTQADIVSADTLTAGDIVKVYDAKTDGTEIGVATVESDKTTVVITLKSNLKADGGSVWVSVTSKDKTESNRIEKTYDAEVAPAPGVVATGEVTVKGINKVDAVEAKEAVAEVYTLTVTNELIKTGEINITVTNGETEVTQTTANVTEGMAANQAAEAIATALKNKIAGYDVASSDDKVVCTASEAGVKDKHLTITLNVTGATVGVTTEGAARVEAVAEKPAVAEVYTLTVTNGAVADGKITVNGTEVDVKKGMTVEEVAKAIADKVTVKDYTAKAEGDKVLFTAAEAGVKDTSLTIEVK